MLILIQTTFFRSYSCIIIKAKKDYKTIIHLTNLTVMLTIVCSIAQLSIWFKCNTDDSSVFWLSAAKQFHIQLNILLKNIQRFPRPQLAHNKHHKAPSWSFFARIKLYFQTTIL